MQATTDEQIKIPISLLKVQGGTDYLLPAETGGGGGTTFFWQLKGTISYIPGLGSFRLRCSAAFCFRPSLMASINIDVPEKLVPPKANSASPFQASVALYGSFVYRLPIHRREDNAAHSDYTAFSLLGQPWGKAAVP